MKFALTYAPEVFDTRTKLMGRQSAGVGFLRAALNARPHQLWCYAASRAQAEIFGHDVRALSEDHPELRYIGWDDPAKLSSAGILYRADPGIGEDAWHRRNRVTARAYSLCGITHTMSSHAAMGVVREYLTAPLYPWDAVICTSTVVRDVMRKILETEVEHLRSRFGAGIFTLPQLPMIPLGIHVSDFAFPLGAREEGRKQLGLAEDEIVVLFVGRLSFHGKAHPFPMFVGLERAAIRTGRKICLLLCGLFNSEGTEKVFRNEARAFAPSIELLVVDGASKVERDRAWAASDIFTSLSDNVQETFGLTPLEAMAAGLPVVVTDWNGYKDTVRDGVDGFRIPTALPPPGCGIDLADRFSHRLLNYDHYVGSASQFAAVDVSATAEAYTKLIQDSDLRRRMGEAGRQRAREVFDWSVIFRRYMDLWDDLAERRRADPHVPGEEQRTQRSDRLDPFALFATYPTAALRSGTRLRLRNGALLTEAQQRRQLDSVSYTAPVLPSEATVATLFQHLQIEPNWLTLGDLLARMADTPNGQVFRAVAWLAKMDIVEIEPLRSR